MTPTSEDEVHKIINNLKDSASGWDEIPPKVIKSVKGNILNPVTYLCNLSFGTGMVPNELKLAKVYLSTNQELVISLIIIDLCLSYVLFQKYMKGLFTTD